MENSAVGALRVADFGELSRGAANDFLLRFPHPFLVVVEVRQPRDVSSGYFTATKGYGEMDELLAIAQGRLLDSSARVFRVVKRQEVNPYSGIVTIGRTTNCDIVVDAPGISKFHTYLIRTEKGSSLWSVSDGKSKNGTRVNDRMLIPRTRHILQSGDYISLGSGATLRFYYADAFFNILNA